MRECGRQSQSHSHSVLTRTSLSRSVCLSSANVIFACELTPTVTVMKVPHTWSGIELAAKFAEQFERATTIEFQRFTLILRLAAARLLLELGRDNLSCGA